MGKDTYSMGEIRDAFIESRRESSNIFYDDPHYLVLDESGADEFHWRIFLHHLDEEEWEKVKNRPLSKKHFDLMSRRSTIIYGSEFPEYREQIRSGIMEGTIEVSLDFNRTSWSADIPEDSVIYRIKVK